MRKFLILFILLTFAFVSIFGLASSMNFNDQGQMANCPLMAYTSSLCQMGFADHIKNWQQMFVFLLGISIYIVFSLGKLFLLSPPIHRAKLYQKEHIESNRFDPLLLAFSDGIVHAKIFPEK